MWEKGQFPCSPYSHGKASSLSGTVLLVIMKMDFHKGQKNWQKILLSAVQRLL